jgi:membrane protease subunit HflK
MSDPILPLPEPRPPQAPGLPPPAPPPVPGVEDASSQALSEAFSSSFRIVKLLMAVLVLVFLGSGMFVVQPNQQAIILFFGKPMGTGEAQLRKPGWHWAWPYPINEVVRIATGEIQTVTSTTGWHATTPEMEARNEEPPPQGMLRPEADGYVLSADGNIIHARATVKYRITGPIRYSFGFSNVTTILTNVLNNALFYASSRMTADAALYKDKTGFRDTVIDRFRAKVTELDLGITLEPSDVETKAPADVRAAFEAVNAAEQERSRKISDALGYRDQITSKALGEAGAVIARGVGSSNRLVTAIAAEARAFSDQLPEYLKDEGLFRDRLLTARLARVMTNAQEKFFLPERAFGQSREVRLELSREPVKREAPPTR